MESAVATGGSRSCRRTKQQRGGRRVFSFVRGGRGDVLLEPETYEGVKSLGQLIPKVKDVKLEVRNLLQIYVDSRSKNEGLQKHAALECQRTLWDMVERNCWCDEVMLFSDYVLEMAKDMNWNFLAQQIVLLCDGRQLEAICAKLTGQADELAVDVCGCRLLCRICEHGRGVDGVMKLMMELANNLPQYVTNRFANFVVIKIMKNIADFPGMDAALMECVLRYD
jgi:hypothetical protein